MDHTHTKVDTKKYLILSAAGIASSLAIIPYLLSPAISAGNPFDIPSYILSTTLNILILTYIGLWIAAKLRLDITPILDNKIRPKDILKPSAIGGSLAAILIIIAGNIEYLFTKAWPDIPTQLTVQPAITSRFLATFYGGITEEIMLRLFMLTLISFIITAATRFIKKRHDWTPEKSTLKASIIIAAIIFGMSHLPTASLATELTKAAAAKIIFLNSIGGIIFGWLYTNKGLESAITAHFIADIIIQIIWPAILALIFL